MIVRDQLRHRHNWLIPCFANFCFEKHLGWLEFMSSRRFDCEIWKSKDCCSFKNYQTCHEKWVCNLHSEQQTVEIWFFIRFLIFSRISMFLFKCLVKADSECTCSNAISSSQSKTLTDIISEHTNQSFAYQLCAFCVCGRPGGLNWFVLYLWNSLERESFKNAQSNGLIRNQERKNSRPWTWLTFECKLW